MSQVREGDSRETRDRQASRSSDSYTIVSFCSFWSNHVDLLEIELSL